MLCVRGMYFIFTLDWVFDYLHYYFVVSLGKMVYGLLSGCAVAIWLLGNKHK